jgi:hypothetical protein
MTFLRQGLDQVCRFQAVSDSPHLFTALDECDEHPVVIVNPDALDGTWQQLLISLNNIPNPPKLIIISRDNSGWADIVAEGGFDSVTRPIEADRLQHLVNAAHLAWTRDATSAKKTWPAARTFHACA